MSEQNTSHNLIEYIFTLLDSEKNSALDLDHLIEEGEKSENSFSHSQNLRTVYEVIRFMDEMPGGVLIYHADGAEEIIYANKALLRIFQCDSIKEFRELTGNSFRGIVHPQDLAGVERNIKEQVINNHNDLDYVEYRIIRKDGSLGWLEDYGHFIHSESLGDIFYVFLSDATEKKNRELMEKAALLNEKTQKEKKLQSLIEEYDKERKLINQEHLRRLEVIEGLSINYETILYVDLNTNKLLPYRLSTRTEHQFRQKIQTLGFTWFANDYVTTWVHPEDRELIAKVTTPEYIREKLSNNKTYYINYRVLNGEELQYLQLRIVNVGHRKHISQIVMGYRRVDEEIQREMEQKQMFEEALNNANLAITAKNTFLSNMSHDMRTPLNAVFGYTALAKKHLNDSSIVHQYLDKIDTASRQLLDLIDKVLEIAWTEANDIRIVETECNLCDIIQDIQKSLLLQAAEKNIAFSLNSAGLEHCDVYSDPDKLKQVLLYLTNNALKYTPNSGKVTLTLMELEKLPNDYAIYQFSVEDTGIGIGKDFLEHIFEPFEREKNTTFSGVPGTGLGLTIAKNIVEMMGGKIDVSSTPGEGSQFIVTLRFRIQSRPLPFSIDSEDTLSNLMTQTILLVEDNEINLEIETEILQGLGFQVDTAINGSIAIDKLANAVPGEFALILMDIQMPIMNGWQAAKAIRKLKHPILSRIPIIALSADAFESDKRKSIESGMDAHLTKPIDVPLLLETMVKTIQIHKSLYGDPNNL
ncbi:MAG: ATP-binding protein [Lachnospiraceae bacterium]|nr:ATP-binding protein [Lachnospiraceae bacterium]